MMQQMLIVHKYVARSERVHIHTKHNECLGCCGLDVVEAHAMVYIELKCG